MVKFSLNELESVVNNISNSMSVSLDDNFKVIVFKCSEGSVKVGAYAYIVTLYTSVQAMSVEYDGVFMVDAFILL